MGKLVEQPAAILAREHDEKVKAARHAQRSGGKELRVILMSPPEFGEEASVMADTQTDAQGTMTVTFQYDYDDLKPEAGWRLSCRAGHYEIRRVAGRSLQCVKIANRGE